MLSLQALVGSLRRDEGGWRATGEVELQSPTVTRTNPECAEPRRRTLPLSSVKANVTWDDGRLLVQPLATGIGSGISQASRRSTAPADPLVREGPGQVLSDDLFTSQLGVGLEP